MNEMLRLTALGLHASKPYMVDFSWSFYESLSQHMRGQVDNWHRVCNAVAASVTENNFEVNRTDFLNRCGYPVQYFSSQVNRKKRLSKRR